MVGMWGNPVWSEKGVGIEPRVLWAAGKGSTPSSLTRAPVFSVLGNFHRVLAPHSCFEKFSVLYLDFSLWKTSVIINLWHLHFQFCCLPRVFILETEVKLPFSGYIFMGAGALFIQFPSCKALFIQELMAVLFLVPRGFHVFIISLQAGSPWGQLLSGYSNRVDNPITRVSLGDSSLLTSCSLLSCSLISWFPSNSLSFHLQEIQHLFWSLLPPVHTSQTHTHTDKHTYHK